MKYKEGELITLIPEILKRWPGYEFENSVIRKVGRTLYLVQGSNGTGHSIYAKENEIISRATV